MGIHRLPNGIVNGAALRTAHPTAHSLVVASAVLSGDGIWNDEARMPNDERKAMRGRIALQKRFRAKSMTHASARFATALGVRTRPRVAFTQPPGLARALLIAAAAIAPVSMFAAPKAGRLPQLTGYKAVRVHYAPLNEMIMFVNINGRPARLLVDTGSNQTMLNADAAESFGVRPSQRGFHNIRSTQINGEVLPVGFAQSLTADGMNLGGSPVTLRRAISSGNRNADVDGLLGLNILYRHKAVINCRTKLVFFKIDQARQINLGAVAASENFTRVPLRREENGALTVPCSIQGQPAHMLVDTGSFLTTFNEGFLKALGLALNPTRVSAHFSSGVTRRMSAAAINDLKIGDFRVPQKKFGVTALPHFTLHQAGTTISGILGIETLYNCHAILDLEGMNLFLK